MWLQKSGIYGYTIYIVYTIVVFSFDDDVSLSADKPQRGLFLKGTKGLGQGFNPVAIKPHLAS
jgi:hypothetical protein